MYQNKQIRKMEKKRKRITMKLKTPNPLFVKWLTEYRDRAKEEGSKMQYVFNRALESLKRYPVPLENGRDCKILNGFGDRLCKMLDDKLKDHNKGESDHLNNTIIGPVNIEKESDDISKRMRKKIPPKYSGETGTSGAGMDPETFEASWPSSTMVKDCTITTKDIANGVVDASDEGVQPVTRQRKGKTIHKKTSSNSSSAAGGEEDIVLYPGSFDIILYVDTCETGGSSSSDIHDDPVLSELTRLSVTYEVRSLKVGDYVWICRDRHTNREFVLPYIIERKRMDDFAQSIKDGRYHEQKFRLKRSGIQNITYLIEKYGNSQYVGLPLTTLYQAATNTAIQDGFCIQFTENYKHTAKYLENFSLLIISIFKAKTIVSCPKENLSEISLNDDLISLMNFTEFNQSSVKKKPLKVSDLFVKMLIQIKGMSVDRALAIVREFPTPATLREAYKHNPHIKGETLLAQIQFGDYKKTIGQALSKTVYQLFTLQAF